MAQDSKIEWTDKTWNPVTGCTKVSQGCKNCYAETFYERFHGKGSFKNVICHEDRLLIPLSWKKPSKVFVNSMSDLFHESIPFEFIDKVYAIMALCPQHTFQVLTKRIERAMEYYKSRDMDEESSWITEAAEILVCNNPEVFYECEYYREHKVKMPTTILLPHLKEAGWYSGTTYVSFGEGDYDKDHEFIYEGKWPLPNVWLGTSVEDQKAADQRIPVLMEIPSAIRFLSCEPLLGPLEITSWLYPKEVVGMIAENLDDFSDYKVLKNDIHWVIAGGESGHGARPMHPDWVRRIRDNCATADIPFLFKQWGEYAPHMGNPSVKRISISENGIGYEMCRVGKKRAGRMLDGVLHDEYPKNTTNDHP